MTLQPWHVPVFAASAVALFVVSVIFLTWPKRVQEWVLKGWFLLFKDYVASPQYVWQVRFTGVVALGMGVVFAYAVLKAIGATAAISRGVLTIGMVFSALIGMIVFVRWVWSE